MLPSVSLAGKRAILFDVDGTLVDSTEMCVQGLCDTFEKFGGRRPEEGDIRAMIGRPLTAQLDKLANGQGPWATMDMIPLEDPAPNQMDIMIDYTIERYGVHKHLTSAFEPTVEALIHLKRAGLRIAAVTSRNAVELEHFYADFPFAEHVDIAVCASDVTNPKPDPECALLACARLGIQPSEALFIGDSVFDMQCAGQAGIARIAVTYGAAPESALAAESPDMIVRSPEELLAWAREATRTLCVNERS